MVQQDQTIGLQPELPVEAELTEQEVPVGISARHIHLSQQDVDVLFGQGYQLKKFKSLYQKMEFAAQETLTIVGPKGVLEKVRIIGPVRRKSQIEVSRTDSIKLGIKAPIRESGKLNATPGCVLIGPKSILTLPNGVIVAAAHIHMSPNEAQRLGVKSGDIVSVSVPGERSLTFNNILVRVAPDTKLEMHVDTDEANAALLNNGQRALLLTEGLNNKLLH